MGEQNRPLKISNNNPLPLPLPLSSPLGSICQMRRARTKAGSPVYLPKYLQYLVQVGMKGREVKHRIQNE